LKLQRASPYAAQIGAELIRHDRRKRLCVPDRLEYLRLGQGARKFQETLVVSRHVVANVAA
jgi:hypothetical protein